MFTWWIGRDGTHSHFFCQKFFICTLEEKSRERSVNDRNILIKMSSSKTHSWNWNNTDTLLFSSMPQFHNLYVRILFNSPLFCLGVWFYFHIIVIPCESLLLEAFLPPNIFKSNNVHIILWRFNFMPLDPKISQFYNLLLSKTRR